MLRGIFHLCLLLEVERPVVVVTAAAVVVEFLLRHVIRGYVYYRGAGFASEDTILEDREWARKSGEAYVKSADLYPEDDENHCFMLKTAIQYYSSAKSTAREMLAIMERIRLAYPKMRLIWRNSASALQGVHKQFIQVMDAEDEFRQALAAGKFIMLDDPIMLQV